MSTEHKHNLAQWNKDVKDYMSKDRITNNCDLDKEVLIHKIQSLTNKLIKSIEKTLDEKELDILIQKINGLYILKKVVLLNKKSI